MSSAAWPVYLLLALLAAAALLIVALFLLNGIHTRQAEWARGLERTFEETVLAWAGRDPAPGDINRLSRLRDGDRAVLFRVTLRILPGLNADAVGRVRSALERSELLDAELANLRHRDSGRRADACRVLGRLGYALAIPALIERLEDPDPMVRQRAVGALGDLRAVEALDRITGTLDATGGWADLLAIMALSRMGPGSVSRVGALLASSTSAAMTKGLLQVTAQLGLAADPARVRALARHDDPEVRVEAVRVLGRIPAHAESVDVCLVAMDDPAWPTRALAARSLGRLGDPRAIPRLQQAMGDTTYWVRHHSGQALAELGEAGREALQRCLADSNAFVRDMATQMLFSSALASEASR